MKQRMSDLIIELSAREISLPEYSPIHKESELDGFKITNSEHEGARYSTVTAGNIWLAEAEDRRRLRSCLSKLITRHSSGRKTPVLVVGIGNTALTADSLGPIAASRITVTDTVMLELGFPKICAVTPGVPARTGLDTAHTVKSIADQTKAELIIAIDSLCAVSPERRGTVVQISECGISPGSAFSRTSGEISTSTMPCPVISIGVPTVIRAEALSPELNSALLVSPSDCDIMVDCYASIISGAVNSALLGNVKR